MGKQIAIDITEAEYERLEAKATNPATSTCVQTRWVTSRAADAMPYKTTNIRLVSTSIPPRHCEPLKNKIESENVKCMKLFAMHQRTARKLSLVRRNEGNARHVVMDRLSKHEKISQRYSELRGTEKALLQHLQFTNPMQSRNIKNRLRKTRALKKRYQVKLSKSSMRIMMAEKDLQNVEKRLTACLGEMNAQSKALQEAQNILISMTATYTQCIRCQ